MSTTGTSQQAFAAPAAIPALPGFGEMSAPGGAGSSAGFSPGDFLRMLRQRIVLIVITFTLLFAAVVAASYLVGRYAPLFTSTAILELEAPILNPFSASREVILPKDYIATQIQSEAARINQTSMLLVLFKRDDFKQTQFMQWYGGRTDKALVDLQDLIKVTPIKDTYLIRVSLSLQNKVEAMNIVNWLTQIATSEYQSEAEQAINSRLADLKEAERQAAQQVQSVRARIKQLRERRDMPAMEAERQSLTQQIGTYNTSVADLKASLSNVEAQIEGLGGVDPYNLPLSNEMKLFIESDPMLRGFRAEGEELDTRINTLLQTSLGENHRQIRELEARRDRIRNLETARRDELTNDMRGRQVESLQHNRAEVRAMLTSVQEELLEAERRQKDLDGDLLEQEEMVNELDRRDRESQNISATIRETELLQQAEKNRPRLRVANPAIEAVNPSRPNYTLYLGGGFVLALLAAVGVGFLREFSDTAVRTPIDVVRYGNVSVLGTVPMLDDDQGDVDAIELASRVAPRSLVAESYRRIRTHIEFSGPLETQKTLLVTSAASGAGNTSTAINLAVTFAQAGDRTLLVDCNFRRPGIREAFGTANAAGMSNVLSGQSSAASVITRTDQPNLDVMTSGPLPPNPAELLGSKKMRELIAEMRSKYDRIIFDAPPCLLISDALVVARLVDGVILVARAVANSKGLLRRARETLDRINARVMGCVLNAVRAQAGGYFRRHYQDFYEYNTEGTIARDLLPGAGAEDDLLPPKDRD